MDWQQLTALGIVAVTAGLFVWNRFRRRNFRFERDTPCGCSTADESPIRSSIVFRVRKGERPQVTVKMR